MLGGFAKLPVTYMAPDQCRESTLRLQLAGDRRDHDQKLDRHGEPVPGPDVFNDASQDHDPSLPEDATPLLAIIVFSAVAAAIRSLAMSWATCMVDIQ